MTLHKTLTDRDAELRAPTDAEIRAALIAARKARSAAMTEAARKLGAFLRRGATSPAAGTAPAARHRLAHSA